MGSDRRLTETLFFPCDFPDFPIGLTQMIYRFGQCELDTERLELRLDGELQAVEPQVFSLLVLLIENRKKVVSKDDLIAAVWGGRIVSDASLSSRVSRARTAVGDSGTSQAIIRTLPRRGFRFVADILQDEATQSGSPSGAHDDETTGKSAENPSSKRKTVIAASIIVVIAVAAGLFFWQPWASIEKASIEKMAYKLPQKPSIAVLPFANLSSDRNQESFGDAITEDIITALSKIPDMFVIAHNSSFTYKGKAVKVQKVAEDLGVRYVLEGSIQRSGNKVRVTVQLIDALSGRHIWGERYDREVKDIFALQDDITRNVVTALEVKLTEGEQARALRRQTENTEAYELFLRAKSMQREGYLSKSVNAEAKEFYEKAIALDPNFAAPWLRLSEVLQIEVRFGWTKNRVRSMSQAVDAVGKALAIDDALPEAYMWLANIAHIKRQYDQVIVHCEKALSLDPTAFVMAHCGRMWSQVGRPEEALEWITKAMRRNPYFNTQYLFTLGNAHRMLGNYDKAIAALEARRKLDPKSLAPLIMLAATYAEAGQMDKARAMVKDSIKRFPKYSLKRPTQVLRYKDPKEKQRILDNLRKAGLPE